jgi:hypothetical protein
MEEEYLRGSIFLSFESATLLSEIIATNKKVIIANKNLIVTNRIYNKLNIKSNTSSDDLGKNFEYKKLEKF